MPAIAAELSIADRLAHAVDWLDRFEDSALGIYAAGTRVHAQQILVALQRGATP